MGSISDLNISICSSESTIMLKGIKPFPKGFLNLYYEKRGGLEFSWKRWLNRSCDLYHDKEFPHGIEGEVNV